MLLTFMIFLACGAVAGVVAGLLGLGGGIVIVPMLVAVFPLLDVDPSLVPHLALGTSLASIVITSLSSARAHNKRGAVRWDIWRAISPGLLLGTFVGGITAAHVPSRPLLLFFIIFLYVVSVQIFLDIRPKASRDIPAPAVTGLVGTVIGFVSSFVGMGGGIQAVCFMTFCNVPMHTAVGTSAAMGFPIAAAGTLGYMFGGWDVAGLPPHTLGYVHVPAFLAVGLGSFCTAPLGARLAHALPVPQLKRCFAGAIVVVASKMLWNMYA